MENGHEERLAERFSKVVLDDSSRSPENEFKNDNLFQVIKAVEAAETTIKEQVWSLSLSLSLFSICGEVVLPSVHFRSSVETSVLTCLLALGKEIAVKC